MSDLLLLGVETATAQLGVAVCDDSGVRASFHVNSHGRHAETLTPAIEFVCRSAGLPLSRMTAVAVDIGPGLFTGLRVGLATAKAIAFAHSIPTIPISSLEVLAVQAQHAGRGRTIVPVIDALSGEVYYRVRPDHEAVLAAPSQLADDLRSIGPVLVVGDGRTYADVLGDLRHVEIADDEFRYPSASTLLRIAARKALRKEFVSAAEISIMYLRKPHVHVKGG